MLNINRILFFAVLATIPVLLLIIEQPAAAAAFAAFIVGLWVWLNRQPESITHGSARFATTAELEGQNMFDPEGIILGEHDGKLLRLGGDTHALTVAPTRSGKGVGHIIPTLCTYKGSAFVIDVKGENHAITARARREMGQKVVVLNPSDLAVSTRVNPLDVVRTDTPEAFAEDVGVLASLLVPEDGQGTDKHFKQQANVLVQALLFRALTDKNKDLRNLRTVMEDLLRDPEDLKDCLESIAAEAKKNARRALDAERHGLPLPPFKAKDGTPYLPAVAGYKAMHAASITNDEWSGVMSTARTAMGIFGFPQVQKLVEQSTFSFADMKEQPTTVYLIITPDQLDFYAPLMRVFVGLAIQSMIKTDKKPEHGVLFLLDEFAQLGHMAQIEKGISILAGYGVRFWIFIQDLSQIKNNYGKGWETLLSNCRVQCFFGVNDLTTAENASKRMGNRTVTSRSKSQSGAQGALVGIGRSANVNESETGRPLLDPAEVMRVSGDEQLIFISGMFPLMAKKLRYFADARFKGLWDKWRG